MPKVATILLIFCFAALLAFAVPQKAQAQGAAELQQGVALFNAKRYEEAIGVLTHSAQQGNVRATYYLGLCQQQLRHDDKAIELFRHIVKTYPNSAEAGLSSAFLSKVPANTAGGATGAVGAAGAAKQGPQTDVEKLKARVEALSSAQWKTLPQTARIPFQMKNGHMYVQAKVKGQYMNIVFDTGASMCGISLPDYPNLFSAAEIEKAPSIPVARPDGLQYMKLVTGEVSVDRVTRNCTIMLTKEPGISVIGQNFFKEYTYEIDGFYVRMTKAPYVSPIAAAEAGGGNDPGKLAKASDLTMDARRIAGTRTSDSSSAPTIPSTKSTDKYSVPFVRTGNCMIVQVMVNGHSTPATFDTGCAPDGLVMPMRFVDKLGIQRNSDGLYAERAEIGPIVRKFVKVHFANGLDSLLIGPKFFGDRPYIVDPANSMIRFQY